jgi:hypothetical protein
VHDEVDTEGYRRQKVFNSQIPSSWVDAYSLKSTIEGNSDQAKQYRWLFEQHWQPPDADKPPKRIYDEIYSSPAFVKVDRYRNLQESSRDSACDLPRPIAATMVWSDATHVAQR